VRREFPDTVFLLEGLGGAWEATEALLTEGGMQWAYSELFQNYDAASVSSYIDHAVRQSARCGLLVHYAETHDNERLAKRGRTWSLMRNRLCALTAPGGGYGFTCGVEWLAAEKLEVHQSRGMAWGSDRNLVPELAALNRLIADHPCFFADAAVTRLSPPASPILALRRDSHPDNGPRDSVLVLVNLDPEHQHSLVLPATTYRELGAPAIDLLGQNAPAVIPQGEHGFSVGLGAGEAFCLAAHDKPAGLAGDAWRAARARSAAALQWLAATIPDQDIGHAPWQAVAERVARDPVLFLAACARIDRERARTDLLRALDEAAAVADLPRVCVVSVRDLGRIVPVPPGHWLLVKDTAPFAATLHRAGSDEAARARSIPVADGHIAAFAPGAHSGDAGLTLERFTAAEGAQARMCVRFLPDAPQPAARHAERSLALLTNGRGGMVRVHADLGHIASKYDCLLGANLHTDAPVDRHVLAKRLRAWVDADGFIVPLDARCLADFTADADAARWVFVANAGDGRTVELHLALEMPAGRNAVTVRWHRPSTAPRWGTPLPTAARVSVTVRLDLEDRGFHGETVRSDGAEHHFAHHLRHDAHGFTFAPAADRQLRARLDHGRFHHAPEWCTGVAHPIEASRGLTAQGDAWSPGWFEVPLAPNGRATIQVAADDAAVTVPSWPATPGDTLEQRLTRALGAFVVRRGGHTTVIAGYPWFLDWGRDTFIAARGMLTAGAREAVVGLLRTFGRFEQHGTLPNMLCGEDASNRDTSDAPLWYAVVAGETEALDETVSKGRTVLDVLRAIAAGYLAGTPNGIRVDPASGLVYSPPHFTWMDTNHPACTPRAGYPIEIQALWIRLLRLLETAQAPPLAEPWWALADRAQASLDRYWLPELGWFADVLLAKADQPAAQAVPDQALRPNQLFAISLGLISGERARRACAAAQRFLLVPGALRSLAPLPVEPPLDIRGPGGRMLADPLRPYAGRYEGDEDTRRKPAYHNGTAWCWLLPTFCEAIDRAWDGAPAARSAARAWLGSVAQLLDDGCVGHLPEILDGDAPHAQRGCDAQAWSVSEALRVWRRLNS
jgi:glycogen debranching enzyme